MWSGAAPAKAGFDLRQAGIGACVGAAVGLLVSGAALAVGLVPEGSGRLAPPLFVAQSAADVAVLGFVLARLVPRWPVTAAVVIAFLAIALGGIPTSIDFSSHPGTMFYTADHPERLWLGMPLDLFIFVFVVSTAQPGLLAFVVAGAAGWVLATRKALARWRPASMSVTRSGRDLVAAAVTVVPVWGLMIVYFVGQVNAATFHWKA